MATPETQSQDGKETEREKKKGGFLARLFGRPGGSGSLATGGSGLGAEAGAGGAWGGFGGAAGAGGLLATKAGLWALILVAAATAGGLGMIGYQLFGSGGASTGGNLQLFAQKPKEDASAAAPAAPYKGDSESLKFLVAANPTPGADGTETAAAAPAPAPEPAAASAAPEPEKVASDVPINKTPASTDFKGPQLKNVGRFGELTKGGGLGSGFTNLKSGTPFPKIADAAPAAHAGSLSAFKKGSPVAGGQALASRRFGSTNAARQAFDVRRDNTSSTPSSAAGGTTYDGAAPSAGNPGAGGGAIGPGGDTGAAQATSLPNPAAPSGTLPPPSTPTVQNEAPWQNAIKTAQGLIGVAVALLLIANMIGKTPPYGPIIAKILGFVVAGIGGMVIALGAQIANGQYGQKLQGGVLAAAGTGLIIAGMAAGLMSSGSGANSADAADATDAGDAADASDATSAGSGGSSGSGGFLGGINPFVLLGGGVGLIGLAGSMMIPPKQYPSTDFKNGQPPDTHWFGYREHPSSRALKKMIA